MTLVNSFDLLVAQMEKAIQINGRLRREAQEAGDLTKYNRLIIFGRRLNSLHAKMTVARAEAIFHSILDDVDALLNFLNSVEELP